MASRQQVASTPTRGTETILLVEDEAGVTAEALDAAGCRVVRAHSVEQARAAATDLI